MISLTNFLLLLTLSIFSISCSENNASNKDRGDKGASADNLRAPRPSSCSGSATLSCSVPNGAGSQTRTCSNRIWSEYSACKLVSCNSGFTIAGNSCVPSNVIGIPVITSPTNGQTVPSGEVLVSWNQVPGAIGYLIRAEENVPGAPRFVYNDNYALNFTAFLAAPGKNYHFWVHARGADYSISSAAEIYITAEGVVTPVCKSGTSETVACYSIANAVASQTKTCNNNQYTYSSCLVVSCNSGYTASGNNCVAQGSTNPSNIINFPLNGASVVEGEITASWKVVPGASKYAIRAEENIIGATRFIYSDDYTLTTKSFQVEAGKSYHFWVHYMKPDGTWSSASESYFTAIKDPTKCGNILNGGKVSRTMYQLQEPPVGQNCKNELQTSTCNNGTLSAYSGSYKNDFCVPIGTPRAQSISQYGITWTFTELRPVGQFANGDWYVIGPVTLANINPKSALPGSMEPSTMGNGSMLNPIPMETQGLYRNGPENYGENSPKYVDSKNISLQLPYTVAAGNSVYSTVMNPDTWKCIEVSPGVCKMHQWGGTAAQSSPVPDPAQEKTWFKETAVLTVLGSVPLPGSFRPPYTGTDKTVRFNKSEMNFNVLRNLSIPNLLNAPKVAWLEEAIKRPLIEMHYGALNSNFKASWSDNPAAGKTGGYTRRTYGLEIAHIASGVGLMLNSNLGNAQLTTDQLNTKKEKLLIHMVQWGIDTFGLIQNGMVWWGSGGHGNGRLLPMYMAAKVLGDAQIMTAVNGNQAFQEISTHFFVDQKIIDMVRPVVSPPYKPYTQDMLGMPEWCAGYKYSENLSSSFDGDNGAYNSTGYRITNGSTNVAIVATILLMGGRQEVNHEPYFRYNIERYYPAHRHSTDGAFSGDGMMISPFARDMWDAHVK